MSSPQTLHSNFGSTLGALLIGVVLGAVFLGITCLQTAYYYRHHPKDSTFMKVLVGVLCILDVCSLALLAHAGYTYLVTNFGNLAVANTLVWSVGAEPPITGIIALSVHLYLSWRIQFLDHSWRIVSVALGLTSFASFSVVIASTILEFNGIKHGSTIPTIMKQIKWCTLTSEISASVTVLTISGSISYLLYRGRSGFLNTDRMLTKLTLYIVGSGAITSGVRVLTLILSRAHPNALYFLIPYISLSKAYTNALLATLNSRASRRDTRSVGTVELQDGAFNSVHVTVKRRRSEF